MYVLPLRDVRCVPSSCFTSLNVVLTNTTSGTTAHGDNTFTGYLHPALPATSLARVRGTARCSGWYISLFQEHGYLGQQQARLLSLLVGKIAFNYMYVPALPLTRLSPPHLEVESSKQEELVRRLMYFCRGIGYRLLHHRKLPPVPKTRNVDSVPSGQTLETTQSYAMRTLCHRALHHLQPADCRRNTMDHLRCLARC